MILRRVGLAHHKGLHSGRKAARLGYFARGSIISNCFSAVRQFQSDSSLVAKPMKQALIEHDDFEAAIFTSIVEPISEEDAESLVVCPIIFQRHIPKTMDIRVTVVGSTVFSVAIDSQSTEETKVDWRRGSNPDLNHEVMQLPEPIADYCVEMVRSLGLRFGAIDLVRGMDGKFWFLECNPNGQWAWIENRTGLPIAEAIVTEMMKMAEPC